MSEIWRSKHRNLWNTLLYTIYRKFQTCIQIHIWVSVCESVCALTNIYLKLFICTLCVHFTPSPTLDCLVTNRGHRFLYGKSHFNFLLLFSHSIFHSLSSPPLLSLSLSLCLSSPHSRLDLCYFAFHLWESGADENQMTAPCTSIYPSPSTSANTRSPSSYLSSRSCSSAPSAHRTPSFYICFITFIYLFSHNYL